MCVHRVGVYWGLRTSWMQSKIQIVVVDNRHSKNIRFHALAVSFECVERHQWNSNEIGHDSSRRTYNLVGSWHDVGKWSCHVCSRNRVSNPCRLFVLSQDLIHHLFSEKTSAEIFNQIRIVDSGWWYDNLDHLPLFFGVLLLCGFPLCGFFVTFDVDFWCNVVFQFFAMFQKYVPRPAASPLSRHVEKYFWRLFS